MRKFLIVLTLLASSAAFAHATVKTDLGQNTSLAGKSETYRLQVPSEGGGSTVQVRLSVPAGVTVSSFLPVPGFVRSVERGADGRVLAVTWTGRIRPDEFQRFVFSARNPAETGTLRWAVEQRYEDGTLVRWDDSTPEHPASTVTLN